MKVKAKRNLFFKELGSIKEGQVFEVDEKTAKSLGKFIEIIKEEGEGKIKKTRDITAKDKEDVEVK